MAFIHVRNYHDVLKLCNCLICTYYHFGHSIFTRSNNYVIFTESRPCFRPFIALMLDWLSLIMSEFLILDEIKAWVLFKLCTERY